MFMVYKRFEREKNLSKIIHENHWDLQKGSQWNKNKCEIKNKSYVHSLTALDKNRHTFIQESVFGTNDHFIATFYILHIKCKYCSIKLGCYRDILTKVWRIWAIHPYKAVPSRNHVRNVQGGNCSFNVRMYGKCRF